MPCFPMADDVNGRFGKPAKAEIAQLCNISDAKLVHGRQDV